MIPHPFLRGLDAAQLAIVNACGERVVFDAGSFLLREGDAARTFYLIERGSVSLETHVPARDTVRVETVSAGDALGLSWLFPPHRVHLDARALDEVTALALDATALRARMEADHDLGYALTRRLLRLAYDRLERVRLQRVDVYGGPA